MWLQASTLLERAGNGRVRAGFTHRIGNLGLHVGDDPIAVVSRRQEVSAEFAGSVSDWVCGEQVHGSEIAIVKSQDRGAGALEFATSLKGRDALITAEEEVTLVTFAADCVPCLFYDDQNQIIAAAHAGWRGTVAGLPLKTAQTMRDQYGTDYRHLWISLGPAIAECCYVVGEQVYEAFAQSNPEALHLLHSIGSNQYRLNLRDIIVHSLLTDGIEQSHIERIGRCTSCENDQWFSHRKEHGTAGRHAGLIRLNREFS